MSAPPACATCHGTGVLEFDHPDGLTAIPKVYCACAEGQRLLAQREHDMREWLFWRRNRLYHRLQLPGRPDRRGIAPTDYSFETYCSYLEAMGESSEPAYLQKVRDFIETWNGQQWLLLYGTNGNGKTGLLYIVLRLAVERALTEGWDVRSSKVYGPPTWYARFITATDYIQALQQGIEEDRTAQVRADIAQAGLLGLDDFGKVSLRDWTAEQYFSLIDQRARDNLPTWVTTNLSIPAMRQMFGDHTVGRLLMNARIIKVEGPDTRFFAALDNNPDLDPADLGEEPAEGGLTGYPSLRRVR